MKRIGEIMALINRDMRAHHGNVISSEEDSLEIPKQEKLILVTRSSLPPLDEYIPLLEQIWQNRQLTNSGVFHQQLERRLSDYLGVPALSLFSSCTAALMAAIKILGLQGEVITTPYTFAATAHALMWCNLKPVFVDIDPVTANIDPAAIEKAITPRTCAILAVHCYGRPCDTDAIADIAKRNDLKVIYDAAHAFGVEDAQGSILNHGDFSTVSFHGAKVFNTAEGGALIYPGADIKKRVDSFKNFGFTSETALGELGFNGKMSELNAALGIAQMDHVDGYIAARRKADEFYRHHLQDMKGIAPFAFGNVTRQNYSYFPVRITAEYALSRDELYEAFKARNILTRRYFYPIVTDFEPYKHLQGDTPVARAFASEVLCLPMYDSLSEEDQMRIVTLLKEQGT